MINDIQIEFISQRFCDMTDAVALLIKNINNVIHSNILKPNTPETRWQIEDSIWREIKSVQAKYPQISDDLDGIRFIVAQVNSNCLQLLPCNLLTSVIFNQIDTV